MADRIELRGLRLQVGCRTVLDDVGLELRAGEVVGLIGPSGAGKTLTARTILGLVDLQPGVVEVELEIRCGDQTHHPWKGAIGTSRRARDRAFVAIRGDVVGWLPQDARAALDPLRRVGWQVSHASPPDRPVDPFACLRRAGLEDPERVAGQWPHELSGGMARRVTIAQALARDSRFLLVDEPTTGLDAPGVQALCRVLRALADDGLGLLVITHDLHALRGLADRLVLIEHGQVVERVDGAELASATSDLAKRLARADQRILREVRA